MITYKHIIGTGKVKTGLSASFSDVSGSKIGIELSAGEFTNNQGTYTFPSVIPLELDVLPTMKMSFCVMLAREIANPSNAAIYISEISTKVRQAAHLGDAGFELVEVLGTGSIEAGNQLASAVNFTEFVFV